MATVYTARQWRIQLQLPNGEVTLDTVSWDKATGGDIEPANSKYNPGGMQPQQPVAGIRSRNDITLERAWSDAMIAAWAGLDQNSGIADAIVTLTPLGASSSSSTGNPIVYTGILGKVSRPDADSGSSTVDTLKVAVTLAENYAGGGTA